MAFAVHVQNMGDFVRLRCLGRLVFDEGTSALRAAVISQKRKPIVLDFTEVDAIDAAGVGTLTELHQHMTTSNRRLFIFQPKQAVLRVLRLTKADSVLNLQLNEERLRDSLLLRAVAPLLAWAWRT
jgi:anti-anti-sigma factor